MPTENPKQSRKNLCIDLRWIDSSGVGVYIRGIMPGIVEQLGDVLITGIGDRSRLKEFPWSEAANVRLIDCHAGRYSLAEQVRLPLAIPSNTDLFFSPYYTIPLLYRGKLAVTVHDMSHLTVAEIVGNRAKHAYAQIMYRAIRKQASLVLTVSEFSKSEFLRLMGGLHNGKITTTHLGISPEWYTAAGFLRLQSRPYIIYVGNIKPYKNLRRLVEAFLKAKDAESLDLVIVGQSEGLITGESQEFFDMVKSADGRIHLTGKVSHQDLLAWVGHAQALFMPSLYEGFGLPPVEAMAAGVPVAVSNAGSLPEVCGDAAVYFDPLSIEDIAAKIAAVSSDPQLCRKLSEAGLAQSKRYIWESCATATTKALREVL